MIDVESSEIFKNISKLSNNKFKTVKTHNTEKNRKNYNILKVEVLQG